MVATQILVENDTPLADSSMEGDPPRGSRDTNGMEGDVENDIIVMIEDGTTKSRLRVDHASRTESRCHWNVMKSIAGRQPACVSTVPNQVMVGESAR